MINLLIQTGAHLVESSGDVASMLCKYVCVFIDFVIRMYFNCICKLHMMY